MNELNEIAKAHLFAKGAFNRAYYRYFRDEVKPCSDEIGWKMLEMFRGQVEKFCFKLNHREQSIMQAAREIFRLELCGQTEYSFEALSSFVKWYRYLKIRIGEAISHLYEFQGDAYAALVDAYPLAGRELAERALVSHPKSENPRRHGYNDEQEVMDAVGAKLGAQWHKLICASENYVANDLESTCRKYYLYHVVWTAEEKNTADFDGQHDGDEIG